MNSELIKYLMIKQDYSASELARTLGVSPSTVYNMTNGRTVSLTVAKKTAKILKVKLDELAPNLLKRRGILRKFREDRKAA